MKNKIMWLFLSCLMVLSMILASCGTKTTPTTQTTKPITTTSTTSLATTVPVTPTTAAATPQYGGILTLARTSDIAHFDPYYVRAIDVHYGWMETLGRGNWNLDPSIFDYNSNFLPSKYGIGYLAESWEVPDPKTYIFHIRKGIHFQDKPPVNGRELTASDFVFTFNRWYGLGSGYTKISPYFPMGGWDIILDKGSVTAMDNYTLVIKSNQPTYLVLNNSLQEHHKSVPPIAREVIDKYGELGLEDWRNVVGTGPFIVKDFVTASSLTLIRNPNYWDFDEHYPQNKLPYMDQVRWLIIPDKATTYAALRTGKIDMVGSNTGSTVDWQQANALKKTNPEIGQIGTPYAGLGLGMRVDKAPFNDIRVRKALQISIDRETIAKTYYGGTVEGVPAALLSPSGFKGYAVPYKDWPQELKNEYAYNPESAKKLLTEAGYPKGFETNVVTASNADLDAIQIVKSYFANIGINMEIRVMDPVSFTAFMNAKKEDALFSGAKFASTGVLDSIISGYTTPWTSNWGNVSDPKFDALEYKYRTTLDEGEQLKIIKEMDLYFAAHHWCIGVVETRVFTVIQPWVMHQRLNGFAGLLGPRSSQLARVWIDLKLKKDMGY